MLLVILDLLVLVDLQGPLVQLGHQDLQDQLDLLVPQEILGQGQEDHQGPQVLQVVPEEQEQLGHWVPRAVLAPQDLLGLLDPQELLDQVDLLEELDPLVSLE